MGSHHPILPCHRPKELQCDIPDPLSVLQQPLEEGYAPQETLRTVDELPHYLTHEEDLLFFLKEETFVLNLKKRLKYKSIQKRNIK